MLKNLNLSDGDVMGIRRKIDGVGRIVIPIEYRHYLNLDAHDEVELLLTKDSIIMRVTNKEME